MVVDIDPGSSHSPCGHSLQKVWLLHSHFSGQLIELSNVVNVDFLQLPHLQQRHAVESAVHFGIPGLAPPGAAAAPGAVGPVSVVVAGSGGPWQGSL